MNVRVLRRYIQAWFRDRRQFGRRQLRRHCPICGFHGYFTAVGRPPRWNARCPNCESRERHRLAHLYYDSASISHGRGLAILHFAPEAFMRRRMQGDAGYITTDPAMPGVDRREDMADLDFPDASFDIVIAHHVLEHIDDDATAMAELYRVLKPGGHAVLSVPQNWSRAETFEDRDITGDAERAAAFGARDHRRYYGRDFSARLEAAGFNVAPFRVAPRDEVRFGLARDEVIHIASKPV